MGTLRRIRVMVLCAVLATVALPLRAYSVLTHEAIVDTLWVDAFQPVLRARFPAASPDELHEARAYAYGGCIIQDLGYYPFGSHFFSDLVHYVRSADFIQALIGKSKTLNETAFALGALAHYGADVDGHSIAVNRAVPVLFPKLRARFGNEVTYADDPSSHLKAEFGLDVLQVARGHYAPESYHNFIGFEVAKDLLARAFVQTYGLELKDQFGSVDLALGTYRFSVSSLMPVLTKAAWKLKEKEIVRSQPGMHRQQFLYNLSRAGFDKQWGSQYRRPNFAVRLLALLARIVPRIGPLRGLAFKVPTPEIERMFEDSFNAAVEMDKKNFADARSGALNVVNRDLDTGRRVAPGEYAYADRTYDKLVEKLADSKFRNLTPELAANILNFYSAMTSPDAHGVAPALDALKAFNSTHSASTQH